MIGGSEFAYAQARIQTRLGTFIGDRVWDALRAQVEFRSFVEQARVTPLAPWLATIAPTAGAHDIERILRGQLRERIHEVASWLPGQWRDAVRWCTQLVDLPAVAHLLGGRETLAWMLDDATLVSLAVAEPGARLAALTRTAGLPAAQVDRQSSLVDDWLAAWRTRWPRVAPAHARRLEQLIEVARTHARSFADATQGDARDGWQARRVFEHSLRRHFRRAFMEPAAVFAFLLLVTLEFERLRGALISRVLFNAPRARAR